MRLPLSATICLLALFGRIACAGIPNGSADLAPPEILPVIGNTVFLEIDQSGNGNAASLQQSGDLMLARIDQPGNNNTSTTQQQGTAIE